MEEIKSPLKAIKAKCLECSAGQLGEVKGCPVKGCALYQFRLGKNPYRKPISDERRQILVERAKQNFHSRKLDKNLQERGTDGEADV